MTRQRNLPHFCSIDQIDYIQTLELKEFRGTLNTKWKRKNG